MTHSEACVDLVATFEGLRTTAYQDQRGIWTLGYGHTYGVEEGHTCTVDQAKAWLYQDLMIADRALQKCVKVETTQNQWDALCSLAYNIGGAAFEASTLVKLLNVHDFTGAANQFLNWDKTNGAVNLGLVNRRAAERKLFLTPEAA